MPPHEEISMEDTQRFLPREESVLSKEKPVVFCGLSKEEIMKYANDPTWIKLRWTLFTLFWIIWVGMIATAVLIVIYTPSCPNRPKMDWWQKGVAYEIDVANFKSSGDKDYGDLKGIVSKIDYLKKLNVSFVILRGNALDQNDPEKIQEKYETESLKDFRKKLDANGIKFVMNLPFKIFNLTSNGMSIVSKWVKDLSDGVIISGEDREISLYNNSNIFLSKMVETTKNIAKNTYQPKFIAFDGFSNVANSSVEIVNFDLLHKNISQQFKQIFEKSRQNKWLIYSTVPLKPRSEDIDLNPLYSILNLLLGSMRISYGEELGSLFNRGMKMKWDNSLGCGFSLNKSAHPDNCLPNVAEKIAYGAEKNLFHIYRELSELKTEPSLAWGENKLIESSDDSLVFLRDAPEFDKYLIAYRLNSASYFKKSLYNFEKMCNKAEGTIAFSLNHRNSELFKVGTRVRLDSVYLDPNQVVVFKLD